MPTALITGASSGLGECFARQLAQRGYDLVITARRAERLESLAEELRTRGRQVRVMPADLAIPGAAESLVARLGSSGLQIDLLVNNAGFGARGSVATLERRVQVRMIELNCRAVVELSHSVLEGMLQRRSGAILNVASTAAFQPGPWMAVYYATKAFVLSFSEALHEEVKDRGVRVAALCPGPTRTEFAAAVAMDSSPLFAAMVGEAATVVADGLRALEHNRAVSISGWRNRLAAGLMRLLPRPLPRKLVGAVQRMRAG